MRFSVLLAATGLLATSAFAQTTYVVPAPVFQVTPPVVQVQPPIIVQTPVGPTVVTNQAGQVLTPDGSRVCPPGLAKKNNGCLPPGQAKKMHNNTHVMGANPAHVNRAHPVHNSHPGKGGGKHKG